MSTRERVLVLGAIASVVAASLPWFVPLVWRSVVARAEASPAARGRELAERLGCFSCHGPGGTGGVPDLGSGEPVPAFTGGTPWEHADEIAELRNWILHGNPKGALVEAEDDTDLLRMPAYRNHVREDEVDDLVAFLLSLSPKEPPSDPAVRRGTELAERAGCFACHGPMGSGGIRNPGSFKGYIPGFFGNDLRELAKDRAEVEGWIRDGSVARIKDLTGASHFLDTQAIKMPAFDDMLSDQEIADLVSLVEWLHLQGP